MSRLGTYCLRGFTTGLVLFYPLLTHFALPFWPGFPPILLTMFPALLNAWLAWFFGRTLMGHRQPLIATFAELERRHLHRLAASELPADVARYTRMLTVIWSLLFVVMASVSAILAISAQTAWWALFTGVVSYVLVGVLFLGEYLYRCRRFPHQPHANPLQLAWLLIKSGPIWMQRTQ